MNSFNPLVVARAFAADRGNGDTPRTLAPRENILVQRINPKGKRNLDENAQKEKKQSFRFASIFSLPFPLLSARHLHFLP